MQAAGLHFGPVSGRQPSAMSWMFRNRSECFSTGAFCNGQVMFVDGEAVASRATDNDALCAWPTTWSKRPTIPI